MSSSTNFNRRRLLQALGLGSAAALLPSLGHRPLQAAGDFPTRVVFFITPQGTTPPYWEMKQPGMPETADYDYPISSLAESEFSHILQPLYRHRQKLLILSGVARSTVEAEYYRVVEQELGEDANAHHVGQAHLLTGNWGMQRPGTTVIGGAESFDQYLGRQIADAGQWPLRVYGDRHQHEYSYVASGEPGARLDFPQSAFEEIMGGYVPPETGPPTRNSRLRQARASALDHAAGEFEQVLPRLGSEDRDKLQRHMDLVRDLEVGFGTTANRPVCDPRFEDTGNINERWARVASLALACDMTRVVTFQTRHLQAEEFGQPPGIDIHQDLAHNSTEDSETFTEAAEIGMRDYNTVYARQFAYFLDQLDSIPEGGETLLDHTAVVWLTELGTGGHTMRNLPLVMAGGACGYFRTGRFVRYGQVHRTPFNSWGEQPNLGPGQNKLFVSLMKALGMPDESFGLSEIRDADGGMISLSGILESLT